MKTFTPAIASLVEGRSFRLATCWKIERADGVTFRFTEHNANIELDGETYSPVAAFSASARQRSDGLKTRNLECVGIITDDVISQDDLRAGRYTDAVITEYQVDWRYPWIGAISYIRYRVIDVAFDGSKWIAQVADVTRWFRVSIGKVYSRNCQNDLGDSRCQVNIASFTESVTVTTVDNVRKSFRASGLASHPDDYFVYGLVTWTSGANNGLTMEVKNYVSATKRLTLYLAMPFDIQVGDTFTVYPGCGLTTAYCKGTAGTKNRPWSNNIENYGGYPFIPGTEKVLQTPNTK